METIGSQKRETLTESGTYIWKRLSETEVLLKTRGLANQTPELWTENDDFAGYVIVINDKGYEFVRSTIEFGY